MFRLVRFFVFTPIAFIFFKAAELLEEYALKGANK